MRFRGLAQTLFFNVCDLPKARFAEGREEVPQPPPWSLREIADSRLRSPRQPPGRWEVAWDGFSTDSAWQSHAEIVSLGVTVHKKVKR